VEATYGIGEVVGSRVVVAEGGSAVVLEGEDVDPEVGVRVAVGSAGVEVGGTGVGVERRASRCG
jgi:hypothetical protein